MTFYSSFRDMFRNASLSVKVVVVVLPLFILTVAASVFLDYRSQERLILEQAQIAAKAKAAIIKEALVQQMVTNYRIEDSFLRRVNAVGEVRNLHIAFTLAGLHLREKLLDDVTRTRLLQREAKVEKDLDRFTSLSSMGSEPQWFLICGVGEHRERPLSVPSKMQADLVPSCERLVVFMPFNAEPRCQSCHEVEAGRPIGAAYLEIPLESTILALHKNAAMSVGIFLVFTLVAVTIGAVIFRKFVAVPVQNMVRAAELIGKGNLDHFPGESNYDDEFGKLSRSLKRMQEDLRSAQGELIQKERLSTVGQMASGIIHDFRSPMTAISLGMELLRNNQSIPESRRQELFEHIRLSLDRMNRMTQDLLDFARGETRLDPVRFAIPELIGRLCRHISSPLHARAIRLNIVEQYDGSGFVDPERLERALINIINNAEDATPQGGSITVETRLEDDQILISIRDTGSGIPEEIRDRIFEPFVTARKKKGTGLGLAISKKIVDQHGGTISYESISGVGTTFTVRLPAGQHPAAVVL